MFKPVLVGLYGRVIDKLYKLYLDLLPYRLRLYIGLDLDKLPLHIDYTDIEA